MPCITILPNVCTCTFYAPRIILGVKNDEVLANPCLKSLQLFDAIHLVTCCFYQMSVTDEAALIVSLATVEAPSRLEAVATVDMLEERDR